MRKGPVSLTWQLLASLSLLFAGLQNVIAQVDKGSLWRDAVVTELDVDFGGTGFHARWRFQRCACEDLLIHVEQVAPDQVLSGELLMVNGKVLLARGFDYPGADIEPLIQAPSLMLQLAYSMLSRSQPKGPHVVNKKQAWNQKENRRDFILDTGLATGVFAAPWAVKGSGWKTETGHRRFEIAFEFTNPIPENPKRSDSITFSGELDFRPQDFPLEETSRLDGWRIQWTSRDERESKPAAKDLTLKALRDQTRGL